MPFTWTLKTAHLSVTAVELVRIQHHLEALRRRLSRHNDPRAVLTISRAGRAPGVAVDLRVEVSPLGHHLISRQEAGAVDHAVRLAVADVERQLERRHARQRGEATYGVPSRRLPRELRPAHYGSRNRLMTAA